MLKQIISFILLILAFILCPAKTSPDLPAEEINDYILVSLKHEYSFPEKDYEPEFYGKDYVSKVEPIVIYKENSSFDKDSFQRVDRLFLTEYGKKHIDRFINILNKTDEIDCAEKDYQYKNVI